jgi:hypothetical protein
MRSTVSKEELRQRVITATLTCGLKVRDVL